MENNSGLADSGARTTFETGAQPEITEDKGRCDLLPLDVVGLYYDDYPINGVRVRTIFESIEEYRLSGGVHHIYNAIFNFIKMTYDSEQETAILELAKHYEAGAKKYSERNWQNGLPIHSFVDSGVRHYLKWLRDDKDEPHDRAFLWNMFGLLWTAKNHPELDDYTIKNRDIKNYSEACMEFAKRGEGGE